MVKHILKKIIFMSLICLIWQTNGYAETAWSGSTLWDTDKNAFVIPDDGETYYLNTTYSLTADLIITGTLEIRSGGSLSVNSGTTTVYNLLYIDGETLNINFSGTVILLGGKIENVDGIININSGGSLYNYYGSTSPAIGTTNLYAGGTFDNVRGTDPESLSTNAGGNFYDGIEVHLTKDLDIDYTWTITEPAIIKGYGNTINLGPDAEIALYGADASLSLDDVIIEGLSGSKLRVTDNKSTFSLHDVICFQDGNFTYTLGTIFVSGDWFMMGNGNSFIYSTDKTMTITRNAAVHVVRGTFQYDEASANDLIYMYDSSHFHLDESTFKATQNCKLETGKLLIEGRGTLWGDADLDIRNLGSIYVIGSMKRRGNVIMV